MTISQDWQAELNGLLIGSGTAYDIVSITGLDDLPDVRVNDSARPSDHGLFAGNDYAGGRTVEMELDITGQVTASAIRLPGTSGNYLSQPDSAANSLAAGTEVRSVRLTGASGTYVSTPDSAANSAGLNKLTANQASLETDTTGWAAAVNCSISRSTAQAMDGSASLAMTSSAAGTMIARTTDAQHAAVAGATYTATAHTRAATSARGTRIYLYFWDSGGVQLSNPGGSTVTNSTSGWTSNTVSAVAPANTAFVSTRVQIDSTAAAGEVHYVDRTSLVEGTGDLDIRVKVALDDWTPAGEVGLAGKWLLTGNQRSYLLTVTGTGGTLRLYHSPDGTASNSHTSSAAVSFADGSVGWVRATYDADNGSGGRTTTFYTSSDGVTWTPLGAAQTTAGGANALFDASADLMVGAFNAGSSGMVTGNVFRAEVRSGIDGNIIALADFDTTGPFTAGQTSGATGADAYGNTWTLNGAATIQRAYATDLDIRVKVAMDDWTPSTTNVLLGKWSGTDLSFETYVTTAGRSGLGLCSAGINTSARFVDSGVSTGFPDGSTYWLRATWRASDGRVQFFTSADGTSWSQLGTDKTISIAGIYDSTSVVAVGANSSGTEPAAGTVYYAEVRANDSIVAQFDPSSVVVTGTQTPAQFTQVGTWTVNGSAWNWVGSNIGDPAAAFRANVDALAAATTLQTIELPLSFRLPRFSGDRRINVRPRRRQLPVDITYALSNGRAILQFAATDPRIYADTLSSATISLPTAGGGRTYNQTYNKTFGATSTGGSATCTNAGNFPTRPVITITGPSSGTVDNPRLENVTTGEVLQINYSLAAGSTLVIDFDERTILEGGTASRYYALDSSSRWWELQPGDNEIRFNANAFVSGSTATIEWRSAWM
jgi:hypothetical protein